MIEVSGRGSGKAMSEYADTYTIEIRISGFIGEVICGQIPLSCLEAVCSHLTTNRDAAEIPEWVLRRNSFYVPAHQIEHLWYADDATMRRITGPCGLDWRTHREIDDLCCLLGFGSGRDGIGIFDLAVFVDGNPRSEFVPFDPGPDGGDRLRDMRDIRLNGPRPVSFPAPRSGHRAISGGSWGKGVMRYDLKTREDFNPALLELSVTDLTPLGPGEEHFISGVVYAGRRLKGNILEQGALERYPVLWHDPHACRWRPLYESPTS